MLIDQYGRHIEYLRVSVTDKCDLRCNYCMPKGFNDFETPENWLNFDEIHRVIRLFSELGTKRIRITGGEPLVRHNLAELTTRLNQIPKIEDLSLSTNATRMEKQAVTLFQSGIRRINVSLDTLNEKRFKDITSGKLSKVLNGLEAAKQAGFAPIKINMVVMKGVNDDEVETMLDYCIDNNFTLRFIETMPMGSTGQEASNHYIDLQEIKDRLSKSHSLQPGINTGGGPAKYSVVAGTDINIGFITPISQHFCDTCNRIRLGVEGTLYMCLGQDHSYPLRELLRSNISDEELTEHLKKAIELKPKQHFFNEQPGHVVRFMSKTGG